MNFNFFFFKFQSISPGAVETDMIAPFGIKNASGNAIMKPIDIADAIIYALSAPQRVNVSKNIVI